MNKNNARINFSDFLLNNTIGIMVNPIITNDIDWYLASLDISPIKNGNIKTNVGNKERISLERMFIFALLKAKEQTMQPNNNEKP